MNPHVVEDGLFAADNVTVEWGGDVTIPYEHETYWPALIKLCADRRETQMQRWRELGATVGLSEWDIRQFAQETTSAPVTEKEITPAPAPVAETLVAA